MKPKFGDFSLRAKKNIALDQVQLPYLNDVKTSLLKAGIFQLILAVSIYLGVVFNQTFYSRLTDVYLLDGDNLPFILSVILIVIALNGLLLSLVVWRPLAKPLLSGIIILSCATSYFSETYGVVFDDDIIASMLQTDTREAFDLFTWNFVLYLMILGLLPSAGLMLIDIKVLPWRTNLIKRVSTIVLSLSLMGASLYSFGDRYSVFFREHKEVRYYQIPYYPIYSAIKYAQKTTMRDRQIETILDDASRQYGSERNKIVLLIIGETARSDHFSLNGYQRETNPLTSRIKRLYSYNNVTSCATSTAYSLPCMFSLKSRSQFERSEALYTENVLDVLQRLGVNVLWRDNNSDSKGVAVRIPYEDFRHTSVNPICDTECRDSGMLTGLPRYIDQQKGDALIVLHQMGNHGPAYAKRYPKDFGTFSPACKKSEISECSKQEILNAYDNGIQYTDLFLAKAIDLLKRYEDRYETTLLYIGDHGESLGENGLYLHGLPYAIAPKEQKYVPLIVWFGKHSSTDLRSVESYREQPLSHDELSYTLLDMFDVKSQSLKRSPQLFYKSGQNTEAVANAF